MKRTTWAISALLAGAALASFASGTAQAAPPRPPVAIAPAVAPAPPPAKFHPPHVVAGRDLVRVSGAAGHAQTLRLHASVGALEHGETVVVQPGKAAPGGLLVKVVSVKPSGGDVLVSTVPAGLFDALGPGKIEKQVALVTGGRPPVKGAPSAQLSLAGKSWTIPVSKVVSCTGSVRTATLTGGLRIEPRISFSYDGGLFSLRSATFTASITEDASLRASISGAASCTAKLHLATIPLPPFAIGPVPVLPSIDINGDVTIGVDGSVSIAGAQHFQGTAGLRYNSDGHPKLTPISSSSSSWTFPRPQISGTGKVEAGLTATFSLKVAGIAGPRVDGRAYVGVSANSAATPWWRLYAGVKVSGGLKLLMFDLGSLTIWQHEWTLANALGLPTRTMPVAIGTVPYSAPVSAVGGKLPYTYQLSGTLPAGLALTADGRIAGTPAAVAGPQTSSFTVVVTDGNGDRVARAFSITVRGLTITTTGLPTAEPGEDYLAQLATSGGSGAVSWHLVSGSLPGGLHLGSDGAITGMAHPSARTTTFTVNAADSTGATATKLMRLYVDSIIDPPGGGCGAALTGTSVRPMLPPRC